MKNKGSNCEFNEERNQALRDAFRQEMSQAGIIKMEIIARKAVKRGSPRFYVSEERATAVVSQLMRGNCVLESMLPNKRRMFSEIHRRVAELRRYRQREPLANLVSEVVNSPAPEFYMSPRTALDRMATPIHPTT